MEYLKRSQIVRGLQIEKGDSIIKLLKPAGEETTYIDEDWADPDKDNDINDDSLVFGRRRWLVEITPVDGFLPSIKAHRYIDYFIETFKDRVKDYPRLSDTSPEDRRKQLIGTLKVREENISQDDFNNLF